MKDERIKPGFESEMFGEAAVFTWGISRTPKPV